MAHDSDLVMEARRQLPEMTVSDLVENYIVALVMATPNQSATRFSVNKMAGNRSQPALQLLWINAQGLMHGYRGVTT